MLQPVLSFFVISGCLVYLGLMSFAFFAADGMIFPEISPSYADGPHIFKLKAKDGESISATFLEAPGATSLMLYCHGNGEELGHLRPFLERFQQRGISILAFDYPGYGTSSGSASELGCYAATEAAYHYAIDSLSFSAQQITAYGRSLGGGPACWLAAHYPLRSLILDSTFTSTFRVITRRKLLPWDAFDNLAQLNKISCPILFIHGTKDQTVPFEHAKINFSRYQGHKAKLWIDGADHSDLYRIAGSTYTHCVVDFITQPTSTSDHAHSTGSTL